PASSTDAGPAEGNAAEACPTVDGMGAVHRTALARLRLATGPASTYGLKLRWAKTSQPVAPTCRRCRYTMGRPSGAVNPVSTPSWLAATIPAGPNRRLDWARRSPARLSPDRPARPD